MRFPYLAGDAMNYERLIAIRVPEPKIQFYSGVHISPRKIVFLKPFSYREFLEDSIYVKLLGDDETLDLGVKLITHLIGGHSVLNESMPPFSDVFGAKLVFHKESDAKRTTQSNLLVDLEEALDVLKSEASRGVVIVAVKDLPVPIYVRSKIKAMSGYSKSNLRTQFIKKKTIESHAGARGYVYLLMNVATAIYAKAGGTPWKLSRSVLSTNGLIIGISFSRKRDKLSDKEVIYYGAIQILDRYGEHLYTQVRMFTTSPKELTTKGLFVPYDKLKSILEEAIARHGRVPQIVIHKSAPIVDEEVKAVKEVAEKYGSNEYPVLYVFAHVKTNTIYRAYDFSAKDYSIRRGLMLLRPGKSSKWIQYIIFTTGRLYRTAPERGKLGTPKPLELAIDTNMRRVLPGYIGEQILALTKLNWNSTDPEIREPITIKYSRRAAEIAPEILNLNVPDMRIADIRDLM
jgi:hypothetical protein